MGMTELPDRSQALKGRQETHILCYVYSTILYYNRLYYNTLYYTILCYAILYYKEKMRVGAKHFVLGTPMEGPWRAAKLPHQTTKTRNN